MTAAAELRLARIAFAIACLVPLLAGGAGALFGARFLGATLDAAADSHFRYLSGLLLAIGLAFCRCIPDLPRQGAAVRLLTAIVFIGGLARLLALPLQGWPGGSMVAALGMELVVTPLLCLWQARIARR